MDVRALLPVIAFRVQITLVEAEEMPLGFVWREEDMAHKVAPVYEGLHQFADCFGCASGQNRASRRVLQCLDLRILRDEMRWDLVFVSESTDRYGKSDASY